MRARIMLKSIAGTWKQFKRSKLGVVGLVITIIFAFMAIAAPFIAPYDPRASFLAPMFSPPSSKHLLGTDDVGRDIFSQIVYGSRISIMVGLLAAAVGTILGTVIGLFAGYYGNILDDILMRVTDIFLIIPFIPLAILFALYMGPNIWIIILLFGFLGWPPTARQIRAQILSLKEAPFVEAARALGASNMRIIFRHLLPNVTGLIIANVVSRAVFAILAEAGLAFIGASDPRNISWGMMIFYAQRSGAMLYGAWWTIVPAGFCIALLACGFAFLGHGITVVLNPRLRGRA
ncbi:MAG: ABC transporter permease [Nitrososphaerota archaeon]|nr:ABC transporter permease [Candidatus Bathyarchaeota archaeon]MDW8023761.1 ABC transporter permease [Nitrososphaerota archaeon]